MIGIKFFLVCVFLASFSFSGTASTVFSLNYGTKRAVHKMVTSFIVNGQPVVNRPFFVRIGHLRDNTVCGGVIIDRLWVLTAAQCVNILRLPYVKVPESFEPVPVAQFHRVAEVLYTEPLDGAGNKENVVALLHLDRPINDVDRLIPICAIPGRQGDLIGLSGIGKIGETIPGRGLSYWTLREILYTVNFLQAGFMPLIDPLIFCDQRNICTDKIGDANSCLHDVGSPVYQFECAEDNQEIAARKPKCLYGLMKPKMIQQSKQQSGHNTKCNHDETFLNITDMLPQILSMITSHAYRISNE